MNIKKHVIKLITLGTIVTSQTVQAFDLNQLNLNPEIAKMALQSTIERYKKQYPAFSSEGVVIPQDFLLKQLKKHAETSELTINNIMLSTNQGIIDLTAKQKLDVNLKLKFAIYQLDWKNGYLILKVEEEKQIVNTNIFGKIFGTIALSLIEVASGKTLIQHALANNPIATPMNNNLVKIHLNKIDTLQKFYTTEVLNKKLSEYIGIQQIKIEENQMHLYMGRI